MRTINVISQTDAYILIRDLNLKPRAAGTIDVDTLLLSELKSIKNLSLRKSILIDQSDEVYISNKITSMSGSGSGGGSASYEEIQITEDIESSEIPFSTLKGSNYILGNPDKWLEFDNDVIVPAYTKTS